MLLRRGFLFAAVLFSAVQRADGDESWMLHGRVIDQHGRPLADVGVSTFWRFDEGVGDGGEDGIEPLGRHPTKTDAAGRFSMSMGWRNNFVLAVDEVQKRGALAVFDPRNPPRSVELKVVPLVRLRGRVQLPATERQPDSVAVVVRLPPNKDFPLSAPRLAMCESVESRFEFWLPPGVYELEAHAEASRSCHLFPYHSVTLTDDGTVDCGALELTPAPPTLADRIRDAKSNGTWVDVDHTRLYGKPAPDWHAVDARGVRKDTRVSDFRGKWILVYFWGPSCVPCLGKGLPGLMEFYEARQADRDRFEIVAICVEPELSSMADLDRELEPVVEAVWRGKELPFPALLDNTMKTAGSYGVGALGEKLLIDPAGRLVPGDEQTLAEKLEDVGANGSKQ